MKRYISLFLIMFCFWIAHSDAIQTGGAGATNEEKLTGKLSVADSATTPPLNLTERSSAPSSPSTGDIYLDDGTNCNGGSNPCLRRYAGSGWEDIDNGAKALIVGIYPSGVDVATGDGKAYLPIPSTLNGFDLIRAQGIVITAGTTGATTIMIYNVTDSVDMLSSAISIASGNTVGTVGTIDTSNDDVATDDMLRIDIDSVSTTAPKGLFVILEFE